MPIYLPLPNIPEASPAKRATSFFKKTEILWDCVSYYFQTPDCKIVKIISTPMISHYTTYIWGYW